MCAKTKSITRTASRLAETRGQVIVKFSTRFEDSSWEGYVIAIGPKFLMLLLIDDTMRFNGFQCLRVQDIRKLQIPAKNAEFAEAALRARGEHVEKKPAVRLESIEDLLLTAGRIFPIVTIHREKVDPDVCHIGKVQQVEKGKVSLLEINPDASWDEKTISYRLREITRVDFGGGYEEALILVGGPPPGAKPRRPSPKSLRS